MSVSHQELHSEFEDSLAYSTSRLKTKINWKEGRQRGKEVGREGGMERKGGRKGGRQRGTSIYNRFEGYLLHKSQRAHSESLFLFVLTGYGKWLGGPCPMQSFWVTGCHIYAGWMELSPESRELLGSRSDQ